MPARMTGACAFPGVASSTAFYRWSLPPLLRRRWTRPLPPPSSPSSSFSCCRRLRAAPLSRSAPRPPSRPFRRRFIVPTPSNSANGANSTCSGSYSTIAARRSHTGAGNSNSRLESSARVRPPSACQDTPSAHAPHSPSNEPERPAAVVRRILLWIVNGFATVSLALVAAHYLVGGRVMAVTGPSMAPTLSPEYNATGRRDWVWANTRGLPDLALDKITKGTIVAFWSVDFRILDPHPGPSPCISISYLQISVSLSSLSSLSLSLWPIRNLLVIVLYETGKKSPRRCSRSIQAHVNRTPCRSPTDPSKLVMKRVVALPQEVVHTTPPYPRPWEIVPPGHVWVEGDDGRHSVDSNAYGPVWMSFFSSSPTSSCLPVYVVSSREAHISFPTCAAHLKAGRVLQALDAEFHVTFTVADIDEPHRRPRHAYSLATAALRTS